MAESSGGVRRRVGPLPLWGWFAVAVGTGLVYYLYKRHEANAAAAAAGGLTGSTAAELGGGGTGVETEPTGGAGPVFTDFGSWEAAVIGAMGTNGIGGADALNALNSWLNGACVSEKAYQALSQVIANPSYGLPPGWGTSLPSISVCPGGTPTTPTPPAASGPPVPTRGPPNLSHSLVAAMTHNGEHIVDTEYDAAHNEWIYLTNKGGIYTVSAVPNGKTTFYGSALSKDFKGGWFNSHGQQIRFPQRVIIDAKGGYTIVDTKGESYHFGP